jgi:hypothetical protein
MRGVDLRLCIGASLADVVAIEGDVDVTQRDLGAAQLADQRVEPLRQHRAPGVNPDQGETLGPRIALRDLVRDAEQRPPHLVALEHDLLAQNSPLPGLSGPG